MNVSDTRIGDFEIYRDLPFVVILTCGRSGSTLLQGILNSIPGFLVRGENEGAFVRLYEAYHALLLSKGVKSADARHPWYGSSELDPAQFAADLAPVIARQLVGKETHVIHRAIGFKEFRWWPHSYTNLWGMLDFLELAFPKVHFILLTRATDDVMKSGWWKDMDFADSRYRIEEFNLLVRNAKISSLFEIDYSDLTAGSPKLAGLFKFLGQEMGDDIGQILESRHSVWST